MKLSGFVDRNFFLVLVATLAITGTGWLIFQSYQGLPITPRLVCRALFPALMWLSIWQGLRLWLRRYTAADDALPLGDADRTKEG